MESKVRFRVHTNIHINIYCIFWILDLSCAEILQEELDSMDDPSRTERTERVKAPPPGLLDKWKESDWTVLNVDFGVPLFDSSLNAEVCQMITAHQLWQRETLDSLACVQKSLSSRLLEFISHHVDASVEGKANSQDVVALPTRSLLFVDGKLSVWHGN